MSYLVSEIVVWLAIAAVFGVAVGWWMRAIMIPVRRRGDRERAEDVTGPETMLLDPRLAELEAALDAARRETAALRVELDEQVADNERLRRGAAADPESDVIARLEMEIAALRGRAEAAENRLVAFARDQGPAEIEVAVEAADVDLGSERLQEAQSRVAELQNELFAQEARSTALREQVGRLRAEVEQAGEDLAAERGAHGDTLEELDELRAVHADCDFAFSALRDQILLLRSRVAELERSAAEADVIDEGDHQPRLGNGTSGL